MEDVEYRIGVWLCTSILTKPCRVLPNPDGPFSARVPTSAIKTANKEVESLLNDPGSTSKPAGKRGQYLVHTEEEKYKTGKRAAEMVVTNTLSFYRKEFADRPLKESTVLTCMGN